MKRRVSKVLAAGALIAFAYLVGAFVMTPPFSSWGLYAVPGCACGHHSFATAEAGQLMLYTAAHNVRYSLGELTEKNGIYTVSSKVMPPLKLKFTFWGCLATDEDNSADFYQRDYLYPLALLTKYQTKKSEQTGPANHRPFGTSGMSPADPGWQIQQRGKSDLPVSPRLGTRAGDTPEASGGI